MKARELIERVRRLEESSYSDEQMLEWLSDLDGRVWNELMETHEGAPEESFEGHTTGESELLIPWPYGREIYEAAMLAKIAEHNGETERYNQQAALFNARYAAYENQYNRTHLPAGYGAAFRL